MNKIIIKVRQCLVHLEGKKIKIYYFLSIKIFIIRRCVFFHVIPFGGRKRIEKPED